MDWLRVLGMMTVFLFHNNRFFDTEGWHVKSAETSQASMMVTIFAVQWMMPLFFLLSGIGIYHALAHQRWPQYLVSRIKRLLVPLLFGIFVIIGYVLAADEGPTRAMERHRVPALLAGVLSFLLGYFAYTASQQWSLLPRELLMSFIRGILCWSWLVALCGFTSRHLRFSNGFLKYANEAVLPFYILHQVVILCVGFYVLRLHTHLWLEYLIIATTSFAAIMAMYELFIRRVNILRVLFGMKAIRRVCATPTVEPLASTQ